MSEDAGHVPFACLVHEFDDGAVEVLLHFVGDKEQWVARVIAPVHLLLQELDEEAAEEGRGRTAKIANVRVDEDDAAAVKHFAKVDVGFVAGQKRAQRRELTQMFESRCMICSQASSKCA